MLTISLKFAICWLQDSGTNIFWIRNADPIEKKIYMLASSGSNSL